MAQWAQAQDSGALLHHEKSKTWQNGRNADPRNVAALPRVRRDTARLRVLNILLWTAGGWKYTLNNPQKRMMVRYDEVANSGQCSHPGISFADYSPNPARSQVWRWRVTGASAVISSDQLQHLLPSQPQPRLQTAEVFLFTPATTTLQHQ